MRAVQLVARFAEQRARAVPVLRGHRRPAKSAQRLGALAHERVRIGDFERALVRPLRLRRFAVVEQIVAAIDGDLGKA